MMNIQYIDHMGSDDSIVNCARVSMDKTADTFSNEANAKLIKYLSKHGHWCFDDQTEILTELGWQKFETLGNSRVAQVNEDWSMSWVLPLAYNKTYYSGSMIYGKNNALDYAVTPNHNMYYQMRNKEGHTDWVLRSAAESFGKYKRFKLGAVLEQTGSGTFDEGAFLGFLLGDAYQKSVNTIGVNLSRSHKINYLENLMHNLGIEYKFKYRDDAKTKCFTIYNTSIKLEKCTLKHIPSLVGKSSAYIKGLLDGLLRSDGSIKRRGWIFSSSSEQLAQDVCYLATLCGYSITSVHTRHMDNPNHNTNYVVAVSNKVASLLGRNDSNETEYQAEYNGFVYCVTVPTGLLMVRRNGKQFICGNSPLSHPKIQVRMTLPIFVARQWEKHRVGVVRGYDIFDQNEISRRYVDSSPEFYYPDTWRQRPEASIKQGSGSDFDQSMQNYLNEMYNDYIQHVRSLYNILILKGVAPEQARIMLPQSMMTSWIETGSLIYWARLFKLRVDAHAQVEIQELARMLDPIIRPLFPVAWSELVDH